MSSFEDNFKRDSNGEDEELEYDDSAFYFFSLALLSMFVMPLTYYTLKSFIYGDVQIEILPASCNCSQCTALQAVKQKEARSNVFRKAFIYRCIVCAFLWYLWFLNYTTVMSLDNL